MIHFISPQTKLFDHSTGIVSATLEDLRTWFEKKLVDYEYHGGEFLVELDTETTGFNPQLRDTIKCIQFGDYNNQFVIDVTSDPKNPPQIIRDILENKNVTFLLANAKFDLRFFLACGIKVHSVWDVFLAECLITAGLRETKEQRELNGLGLDFMAKKYLDVVLDKSIRGNIHREGLTDRVIKYAADDVKYLNKIREKQLETLTKWGMLEVIKLENEVVKVFARMEYDGIFIDEKKWITVADITSANAKALENQLDDIVRNTPNLSYYVPRYVQSSLFDSGTPVVRPLINWGSPTQVLGVLNRALEQPLSTDSGAGSILVQGGTGNVPAIKVTSTDEKTLQKLKEKHALVPVLVDYAKQKKLSSSFGHDFLKHRDKASGRIYPDYWQILSTGRISASNPNVNQIPSKGELARAIRAAFVAKPGRKIVGGDYSGMELRIIAEFSKDPTWIKVFVDKGDLHTVLCAKTFSRSYQLTEDRVKEKFPPRPDWSFRDVQKTIGFGLAYGMTEYKLSNTAQIAIDTAKEIIDDFFAGCPDVEKFLKGLGKLGTSRNYVRTAKPFSRPRFFYDEPSKDLIAQSNGSYNRAYDRRQGEIERASKNHPIQGTNGDIIKVALCMVQDFIDKHNLDIKIMLSVYDEIQTDCEESIAEWWKVELRRLMIEAAQVVLKTVPVEVDVKIADHWTK